MVPVQEWYTSSKRANKKEPFLNLLTSAFHHMPAVLDSPEEFLIASARTSAGLEVIGSILQMMGWMKIP